MEEVTKVVGMRKEGTGGLTRVNPPVKSFQLTFHLCSPSVLHFQLAGEHEEFEELPMAYQHNAVTAPCLVPLLEPEQ